MLFWVFLLLGIYASAVGSQDFGFVCGTEPRREGGATGQSSHAFYSNGTVRPVILFGKLKGDDPFSLTNLTDRFIKLTENVAKNQSSADILNPGHVGSLSHYFKEMSYDALTLEDNDDGVEGMWFEANSTKATDYGTDCYEGIIKFAFEVFSDADDSIDFGDYDKDGDGVVDLVILFVPDEFRDICGEGAGGKVIYGYDLTDSNDNFYKTGDSVSIENDMIVVLQRPSFPWLVGVAAHEYGHLLDLPDLYDKNGGSVGIGSWGVMGRGSLGYRGSFSDNLFSGPNPLSVWSRYKAGWITEANGRLVKVESDTEVTLDNIHSLSSPVKAYKVPVRGSDTEYFLMANRQNTYDGSSSSVGYYDDLAPANGLAIWHIDDSVPGSDRNKNEEHKAIDLECADGLFSDNKPDPVAGGDDLDHLLSPGDATDLWDGSTERRQFTPYSNPSTYGYSADDQQSVFSGIAVRNIRQTNGVMSVDVHFIPSAPRDLGVAANGDQTQVTLAWSEPMVNATAITEYQYSIDDTTNWKTVDGGASATSVSFDNSTSTTFYVRAVTANEQGKTAQVVFDRPGTVGLEPSAALTTSPSVGDVLTATLSDPNVSNGQNVVVLWQWQRKRSDATAWTNIDGTRSYGTNTNRYTLTEEDVGEQVRATANYDDGAGTTTDTAASAETAVVVPANSPPEFDSESPTLVKVAENITAVYTYTATDPDEGDTITWLLGTENDEGLFTIGAQSGELAFNDDDKPNFEAPADADLDNEYAVSVIASDGTLADTLDVTVTVTNVEEAGTLVLSPLPPQVDVPLQAELTDADGQVRDVEWAWYRQWPPWQGWRFAQAGPPHTPNRGRLATNCRCGCRIGTGTARFGTRS